MKTQTGMRPADSPAENWDSFGMLETAAAGAWSEPLLNAQQAGACVDFGRAALQGLGLSTGNQ